MPLQWISKSGIDSYKRKFTSASHFKSRPPTNKPNSLLVGLIVMGLNISAGNSLLIYFKHHIGRIRIIIRII